MPPIRDAIRYPAKRVLLHRTRLAYVHLRNLLSDAKRDRSARVSGYVAVWMPEELLTLYLEEGEVVNATVTADGLRFAPIAIADAVAHVPSSAEYGSICFHEAENEQLDLMYASQTGTPLPWPRELTGTSSEALLNYLDGTMHDGAVEIVVDGRVHFVAVEGGRVCRGYFVEPRPGDPSVVLQSILDAQTHAAAPVLRLWGVPEALPAQASPALIQSYRELMAALTAHLRASGNPHAAEITEGARRTLLAKHPLLERFSPSREDRRDPVADPVVLTTAIGTWIADVLWAASPAGVEPEDVIRELTADRRHVFQSAGLYDTLPWKVQW